MKRAFLYFAVIATGCAAALALRVRVGTELQSHGGGASIRSSAPSSKIVPSVLEV